MKVDKDNLKQALDIASEINEEGFLLFKKDKVEVQMLSTDTAIFMQYEYSENHGIEKPLFVNYLDLKKALSRLKTLDIEIDGTLKLTDGTKKFEFPLIVPKEEQKIRLFPVLPKDTNMDLQSEPFFEAVKDAVLCSEVVLLAGNEQGLFIKTYDSLKKYSNIIDGVNIVAAQDVSTNIALDYLQKTEQGKKIADEFEICFSKDTPLGLEFNGEGKQLRYMIANRVVND